MNAKIIGNMRSLFSMHGEVDAEKALKAIEYMTEASSIDIDKLNKASEVGLLYIRGDGKMLETADKVDEQSAKYKIVPTGLNLRFTKYPLFASFIKMNGFWEGTFIGTGIQLFEMYKKHYTNVNSPFNNDYKKVFGEDNKELSIQGFGLKEILDNRKQQDDELIYQDTIEDTSENITAIEKAIEKAKKEANNSKNKRSQVTKAQRKAARLEAHLRKLKNDEKKKIKGEEQVIEEDALKNDTVTEENNNSSRLAEVIKWLEVPEIEDVQESFEDQATKDFKQRLHNSIGAENNIKSDFMEQNALINNEDTPKPDENKAKIESEVIVDSDSALKQNDVTSEELLKTMDHDYIEELGNGETTEFKYEIGLKLDLMQDIYDKLLIKEYWQIDNKNRIGFYLSGIFLLISMDKENNGVAIKGNGYVMSKDLSKQVVNIGLIDKYGNDIYLVDHTPYIHNFYLKKVTLLTNKALLLDWGFDINDIRKLPQPVKFVDNASSYIFDGYIEDFDLNDSVHFKHIIEERISRFPEKYRNESIKVLSDKLKQAIEQAIKISKSNFLYIVPKYNFERNQIQFLIPFYFDRSMDDQPELTIVVGKYNGLWQVYTVLHTDDAYDDARLIFRPSSNWLIPNKARKTK